MKKLAKIFSLILSVAMLLTCLNLEEVHATSINIRITKNSAKDNNSDDLDEPAIEDVDEADEDSICENVISEEDAKIKSSWSVYVYMLGGNSETENALASCNIQELLSKKADGDVNFVLQAGGARKWHLDDMNIDLNPDRTQRFVIKSTGAECVYDEELVNMGESSSLKDFLSWGKKNYPAEKSVTIIYGEGMGFLGLGTDEIYKDSLTISDIETAFEDANFTTDILAFDASYMADLDVMIKMEPFANYMIASENIISDYGFDYEAIVDTLADDGDVRTTYLARRICDSYYENSRDNGEDYVTLSVTDLSYIGDVRKAAEGYFDLLRGVYEESQSKFATLLSCLLNKRDYGTTAERDLRRLVEETSMELEDGYADLIAMNVEDAVRRAVSYKVQGEKSRLNNGISLAYGFTQNGNTLEKYEDVSAFPEYIAILDAVFYEYHPDSEIYNTVEKLPEANRKYFIPDLKLKNNKAGFSSLKVDRGLKSIVYLDYEITKQDEEGHQYTIQQRSDLNYSKKYKKFYVPFDGKIVALGNSPIVLSIESEDADGTYINAPVSIMNSDGVYEDRTLCIYYDSSKECEAEDEAGRYSVLGLMRKSLRTPDGPTYTIEEIKEGTLMRAAYPKIYPNEYIYGTAFEMSPETAINMMCLEDGEYSLNYLINTCFDKRRASDSQEFTMESGKMTVNKPDKQNANMAKPPLPIVSYKKYYGHEPSEVEEKENASVTMLSYVCGADLERAESGVGSDLLDYATNISDSENVNILFETGGAPYWKYSGIDADSIQRFEAHSGKLVEVSKTPAVNMSTGDALLDFINWGVTNYPADNYILYVYDHGGAWRGTCWDSNFNRSHISLKDWIYALSNSGVVFEDIIFDECLMATVEVASAIAPYARYMTGYEVAQTSADYEWDRAYQYLINHSDDFDAEQFGKMVVDMNADAWDESLGGMIFQTMSLIDLSKIGPVVEALDEYSAELVDVVDRPKEFTQALTGIEKSHHYDYSFQKDIVDMMNMSSEISQKTKRNVVNAVEDAVVYKRTQFDQLRNSGLAMFFEISNYFDDYDTYADLCPMPNYVKFLDKAVSSWHAKDLPDREKGVNPKDYDIEFEIIEDGLRNGIKITKGEDNLYRMSYQVLKYDKAENCYHGIASRDDFTKGDDGEYFENFDGRVAAIDGIPCFMEYDSVDDDRILYNIPIKCEGMDAKLSVAYYPHEAEQPGIGDFANGKYEIIGATLGMLDIGVPEKNSKNIPYGVEITFTYPELTKDGKLLYSISGESTIYSEDMKLKFMCLDDDEYIIRYIMQNGLKEPIVSDDILAVVENGRLSYVGLPQQED